MSVRKLFLAVSLVAVMLFSGVLLASRNTQDVLFRALGNLAEVVHLVESEYVDELNQEALAMALDSGLVEGLDRSAAVLPSDQVGDYLELIDAPPPFGLGLTSRLGSAAVQFTLSDSPAEAAGLDLWEVIELVDGVNSRGRPLWQIRLQLMEAQNRGLPVALTVFDREVDERRELVLEPTEWTPRAASAELHDEGIVIHVEAIPIGATESIAELLPEEGRAILDLRELRWGVEEETITLADSFIGEGMIGEWKGRRAGSRAYTATADALANEPPIVLVGPMTEGVGEILAAALQRHGARVIGQKTRGHAPYMSLVRDGDVAVWMPVGQWLRADQEPIEKNGIVPDEEIEAGPPSEEQDPVLDRALRILATGSEAPEEEELEEAA
jgi:C-terminal processing protease CtpA/Prc